MTEQEIFERLFFIAKNSNDTMGIVACCLVRNGVIIAEAVSKDGHLHAEYVLLQTLKEKPIEIRSDDVVYTTLEPCGKRTPGGPGETMGDCTTNLIFAGVKHIVYAAADPDASDATRHKFADAGAALQQVSDRSFIKRAVELFNSTYAGSFRLPSQE